MRHLHPGQAHSFRSRLPCMVVLFHLNRFLTAGLQVTNEPSVFLICRCSFPFHFWRKVSSDLLLVPFRYFYQHLRCPSLITAIASDVSHLSYHCFSICNVLLRRIGKVHGKDRIKDKFTLMQGNFFTSIHKFFSLCFPFIF